MPIELDNSIKKPGLIIKSSVTPNLESLGVVTNYAAATAVGTINNPNPNPNPNVQISDIVPNAFQSQQISPNSAIPMNPVIDFNHLLDHLSLSQSISNEIATNDSIEESSSTWEPKYLNARHREIMRRLITGASLGEIAQSMGIHAQTVGLVTRSKLFREELEKLESSLDGTIASKLANVSGEALDSIVDLMRHSSKDEVKLRSATEVLDRAGYVKVDKQIIGVVRAEDVIKELNKRRREASSFPIVDGEVSNYDPSEGII